MEKPRIGGVSSRNFLEAIKAPSTSDSEILRGHFTSTLFPPSISDCFHLSFRWRSNAANYVAGNLKRWVVTEPTQDNPAGFSRQTWQVSVLLG
jgi:hypothetical protein